METPDYVYQNWLKDAYEGSSKDGGLKMLKLIHEELQEVNENLRKLLGARPSPS